MDDEDFEEAYDQLWDEICSIGEALAEARRLDELPDEWPNLVRDWLLEHKPDVLDRGVTDGDVAEAFAAWEIGSRE